MTPPLTTIRQSLDAMTAAVGPERLVHTIENPRVRIPPTDKPSIKLIMRTSPAPPATRA